MSVNILVMAPDGLIWDKTVDEVVLPSTTGQIGVLKDHTPLVSALGIGILRIKVAEKWTPVIALGGFATIMNNAVTVLVSGVEEVIPGKYDEAVILLEEATNALEQLVDDTKEKFEATQILKCAAARVQAYNYID